MHKSITSARVIQAVEEDDNTGFCHACGADASDCEPDAREYECETCGELAVFSAEETLMMLVP